MAKSSVSADKLIQTAVVGWLVPGGGHFVAGQRRLGWVFFAAISFLFFGGLVLGGMKNLVNPTTNRWLFMAEMGIGGYTIPLYIINHTGGEIRPEDLARLDYLQNVDPQLYLKYVSPYPAADVAYIYLVVAGLLNVLAILDALTRMQTGGLPTYYREISRANEAKTSSQAGGPAS